MARGSRNVLEALREFALGLPGAIEDFPWGERVFKVNKKVFVFMGKPDDDTRVTMSVKLKTSSAGVLSFSFAEPTGYGLGKSGWVTIRLGREDRVPVEVLCEWIEESYRAVAPKKLAQELDGVVPAKVGRSSKPKKAEPKSSRKGR